MKTAAPLAAAAPLPGDLMLRRGPLIALLVVAFNAFVLQPYAPGVVSGILGDFGTCFILPILLVASLEWVHWCWCVVSGTKWQPAGRFAHTSACVVAASYYILLELSADFGGWHAAVMTRLSGGRPVTVTRDMWDLLAVPLVLAAWWWLENVDRDKPRG